MATSVNNATNAPVQPGTRHAARNERAAAEEHNAATAAAEEQAQQQNGASAADTLSLSDAARQLGGQGVGNAGSRPPMDADSAAEMAKKLRDLIGANGGQAIAAQGRVTGSEVALLLNVTA